ncbi:MAG TPA: hypothetical protein VHD83_02165 [Puia sp.]|nr:hypothetical protein [Puia sp.]
MIVRMPLTDHCVRHIHSSLYIFRPTAAARTQIILLADDRQSLPGRS